MLDLPPSLEPLGQIVGIAAGQSLDDGGEKSDKCRPQEEGGCQKND
jgi:hypothetical protein